MVPPSSSGTILPHMKTDPGVQLKVCKSRALDLQAALYPFAGCLGLGWRHSAPVMPPALLLAVAVLRILLVLRSLQVALHLLSCALRSWPPQP